MTMNIMPAFILTALSILCNLAYGIIGAVTGNDIMIAIWSMGETVFNACAMLFALGVITLIIPIAFAALFVNPGWKPIQHKATTSSLSAEFAQRETSRKIS